MKTFLFFLTLSVTLFGARQGLINDDFTVNGVISGSNLSGTNTGDQTLNSLLPTQTSNSGKFLTTDGSNSSWATVSAGSTSPLTTKGDVWGFSTVDARIPIGSNNQVLTADSSQTLGLKWATITAGDFSGPSSSVDNTLVRYDGTTGKLGQASTVTVDDNGAISNTLTGGTTSGLTLSNGTASAPILTLKDNSTDTFVVSDGGSIVSTLASGSTTLLELQAGTSTGDSFSIVNRSAARFRVLPYGETRILIGNSGATVGINGLVIGTTGTTVTSVNQFTRAGIFDNTVAATDTFGYATTGAGGYGISALARGSSSTTNAGNAGVTTYVANSNLLYGELNNIENPLGSNPKIVGTYNGIEYTGATIVAGFYANLCASYAASCMQTMPSVSALFLGNNSASGIDLLNLQSNGTTVHLVEGSGDVTQNGNLKINVAGKGISVKEGSNAKQGTCTLVAGTCTVSNTSVTSTSRIILTAQSLGTILLPAALAVTARTAATSFVITSSDATDTSVVAYEMFEVL